MSKKNLEVALPPATPAPRPLEDIQKQYSQLVAELGQKHYHVKVLKDEIDILTNLVRDLNQEAAMSKQLEAAKTAPTPTEASSDAQSN